MSQSAARREALFLKACRREPVPRTPVWLMRQAGRYQREYREIRSRVSMLELCKSPELSAEVTLMAVDMLKVDAAIIFADILLIVEPMGLELEFAAGEGPVIHNPVRSEADVERLRVANPEQLGYVLEAISRVRKALPDEVALIGFAGAPFTLASYMVEGGRSSNYELTKRMMWTQPRLWNQLMEKLSVSLGAFLQAQAEAGADAVQLFDSWVGALAPADFRGSVLPHVKAIFSSLPEELSSIYFGTGTTGLLGAMAEAGSHVMGLDWRVELADGWSRVGHDRAVQGNLDPLLLLTDPERLRQEAARILAEADGRPGHIFNLGHGVLPQTPVENVKALVEAVRELSSRR